MNGEPTLPASYPREGGSPAYALPLQHEGPADFFPPVCLQSHWDPTAILRRTVPEQYVAQPMDFRPWTRICMQYTTAGEAEPAPAVKDSVVLPSGGQFYPPSRYAGAIDRESQLRRLDRPLGTCEGNQWEPHADGDMFDPKALVPGRAAGSGGAPMSPMVQELAYPQALLRSGPYECRAEMDEVNVAMSSDFMFNNATKQDKYKLLNKGGTRPVEPVKPIQAAPAAALQSMRPDLTFQAGQPEWQKPGYKNEARSYEAGAAAKRADLVASAATPEQQREAVAKARGTTAASSGVYASSGQPGVLPSYAFPSQFRG